VSRRGIVVWASILGVASMGLYHVKYRVQGLEHQLTAARSALETEQAAIHVLEAEWAYLNRPERLQALAERHLAMTPVTAGQIVDLDRLPYRGRDGDAAAVTP
jgi:cell division protein FtsL